MKRVEDKYILSDLDMMKLEKRVSSVLKLDTHSSDNGYKISSIYFDDIYDSSYMDSLNGNPFRRKYRIRIYDDNLETIKLEVKEKEYNRAIKISSTITEEELKCLLAGKTIFEQGNLQDARTLFNLAIKTKMLRPRINVTYERHAYLYDAGNVRITFDRGIRSSKRLDLFGDSGLIFDYPEGNGSVLEVKYDECMPHFLKQLLEHEKMIQTSNSKYVICRDIYRRAKVCR